MKDKKDMKGWLNKIRQMKHIFIPVAALVVFVTTYLLVLPAFTASSTTYCGLEEHQHDASCYEEEKELICGQEESAGHQHTDECYEEQQVLTCTNEDPDHVHDDSCYTTEKELICGQEESEGHQHTDECYETTEVLICDKEEHTHDLSCYSNPEADVETAANWEKSVESAELTGNWSEDLVNVAKTQIGYAESTDNYQVDDNETMHGYTRYGAWAGDEYGDWNADFAAFCINYAQIPTEEANGIENADGAKVYMPTAASVAEWIETLCSEATPYYHAAGADSVYQPKTGDLIFLKDDNGERVGIIETINYKEEDNTITSITVIEGIVGDSVQANVYSPEDEAIEGYGEMPANPQMPVEQTDEQQASSSSVADETQAAASSSVVAESQTAESEEPLTLKAEGDDYVLTVTYTEEAQIPEGTTLQVEEILPGTEEYEACYEKAKASMEEDGKLDDTKTVSQARFFDVKLICNDEEIEPEVPVTVTVTPQDELAADNEYVGVHVTDDGASVVDADPVENEDGQVGGISYSQDGFSYTGYMMLTSSGSSNYAAVTSGNSTVNVSISWPSGSAPSSGSCVVRLYEDGTATDKTLTLTSSGNWTGSFTGLSSSKTYTVQLESQVDGYSYTSTSNTQTGTSTTTWTKATSLESGNTYVLVHNTNNTNKAVQNSSGNSLSAETVTISGNNITSTVSNAMQWKYNGTSLQNVETSNYLRTYSWNNNKYITADTKDVSVTYSSSKLKAGNYYLRYSDNSYSARENQDKATNITLYKKTTTTTASQTTVTFTATSNSSGGSGSGGSSGSSGLFDHKKYIDSLNDGVSNPDTGLAGQDFYRLYLDMTGQSQPVDVLFVVDASGSMDKTDVKYGNSSNVARDTAITMLLNGSASQSTSDGLISKVLAENSENKVAVIRFYGNQNVTNSDFKTAGTNGYKYDSDIKLEWTSAATFTNCANEYNNGTDYEAGLLRAAEMLEKVKNDNHKKMMIFISDGVPTFFIINNNDVGTYKSTDSNGTITTTLSSNDVGKRWGTGVYSERSNYLPCKIPSERAYDDLIAKYPDLITYTVGVSANINATSADGSQCPDVLKYMVGDDDNKYFGVTNDVSTLSSKLMAIFNPKGVTITDELSQYVRYYGDQPDVKVTMTDKTTGAVTVLYENGSVTSAGQDKFVSVTYQEIDSADAPTGSTGKITAKFVDNYGFGDNYIYTLSFNVKTTQTAYNEYIAANEQYNATGDANTDYSPYEMNPSNQTSSGKPGFHSNTTATVSYKTDSTHSATMTYNHPVVQVEYKAYELPATGGTGTQMYLIIGEMVVGAAVALGVFAEVLRRVRMNAGR